MEALFDKDPSGAILGFSDMMRKQIVMPAHLMDDMEHPEKNSGRNLFAVREERDGMGWDDMINGGRES